MHTIVPRVRIGRIARKRARIAPDTDANRSIRSHARRSWRRLRRAHATSAATAREKERTKSGRSAGRSGTGRGANAELIIRTHRPRAHIIRRRPCFRRSRDFALPPRVDIRICKILHGFLLVPRPSVEFFTLLPRARPSRRASGWPPIGPGF